MKKSFCAVTVLLAIVLCSCDITRPTQNTAQATPGRGFTGDDIAELKWLEGTWRGMDGDKPFFERYRLEGTTLVVEGLADESLAKVTDTSRFELRDGEFGKFEEGGGSRASSISSDAVQFVPAKPGKGNSFRFERNENGWRAILEWPAQADKPARNKIYVMEAVR